MKNLPFTIRTSSMKLDCCLNTKLLYVFIVHVLQHWIYPLFGIDALAMLPILSNRTFVFTLASYLLL